MADTLSVSHSILNQKPALKRLKEFEGNGLHIQAPGAMTGATRDIVFDQDDRMWIAARKGALYMWDSYELHRYDIPGAEALMDMCWTDDGRLWIATEGAGIVVYDGVHFLQYSPGVGSRTLNFVYLLPLDGGGMAAASYDQGLLLVLPNETRHYSQEHGLPSNALMGLALGHDGALWTGHWFGGWAKVLDGVTAYADVGLPDKTQQRFFLPGPTGQAWICADNGVYQLELNDAPQAKIAVPGVFAYCAQYVNDTWYFGTSNDGIFTLSASGEVHGRGSDQGLPSDRVAAITPDRFGNIWLGFYEPNEGLLALLPEVATVRTAQQGLPGATVHDVFWDSQGRLWTTFAGSLVARSDDGGAHFTTLTLPTSGEVNVVCMTESPNGDLWFAASREGAYRLRGNTWKQIPYAEDKEGARFITTMLYAHNKLWCGGLDGLFVVEGDSLHAVLNGAGKKVVKSTASGIIEDSRGNVWVSTGTGELHCIPFLSAIGTKPMLTRRVRPDSTWAFPGNLRLHDITENANGHLWVASDGAGTFGFDLAPVWEMDEGATNIALPFEQADTTGYVGGVNGYAFLKDDTGAIWTTTSSGLVKWVVQTEAMGAGVFSGYTPHVLSEWHGLYSAGFDEDAGSAVSAKGAVWFGLKKGLIGLEPLRGFPQSESPQPRIAHVNSMGQRVHWASYRGTFAFRSKAATSRSFFPEYVQYSSVESWSQLPLNPVFSFDQDELEFELTAVQWGQTTPVEFRYRTNTDEAWTPYRINSVANFKGLKPGSYNLQFQARDAYGTESEIEHFDFTIQSPVWQTPVFIGVAAFVFLMLIVVVYRLRVRKIKRENRILEEKVDERTEELRVEKKKSDDLLLNILPRSTAEELKENGKAKTQSYESCSVLFSDFKGFTQLTETVDSHYLVEVLDRFFQAFDQAAVHFGLEKIKTIGDAYMCASGLPHPSENHAARLVAFGLEMLLLTDKLNAEIVAEGGQPWPIRIGVHSGPVIAGVVGKNKFAYDVWGDTVNTAARMESSGEPGKLNISGQTKELVDSYFNCEARGAVAAKNKGNLEMYFVEGFHRPFAAVNAPMKPNADFARAIKQNVIFPSGL